MYGRYRLMLNWRSKGLCLLIHLWLLRRSNVYLRLWCWMIRTLILNLVVDHVCLLARIHEIVGARCLDWWLVDVGVEIIKARGYIRLNMIWTFILYLIIMNVSILTCIIKIIYLLMCIVLRLVLELLFLLLTNLLLFSL